MSIDPELEKLSIKIEEAKAKLDPKVSRKSKPENEIGRFLNVGVELTAGVLLGVGLGLLVDWIFNLSPWGLITFFILGSIAGMMNVYRAITTKDKNKDLRD